MTALEGSSIPLAAKVDTLSPTAASALKPLFGALAFLPVVLLLALPWVAFDGDSSPQAGVALLFDRDVNVDGTEEGFFGTITVSGTVHIPAQWPVRLVAPIAMAGALLWWLQGWRGRAARTALAFLGAFVTVWGMMVLYDGHFPVAAPSHAPPDSSKPDDIVPGPGAYLTVAAFCVVGLVNLMLRSNPQERGLWRRPRNFIGIHVLAIPVALGIWGIAFVASRGGPLAIGPEEPGSRINRAIPGDIAFIDNRGCIQNVAASGKRKTEVYCFTPNDSFDLLSFEEFIPYRIDDGAFGFLKRLGTPGRFELFIIDAATGQAASTGRIGRLAWESEFSRGEPQIAPTGEWAVQTHDYIGDYTTLQVVTLGSGSRGGPPTKVAELDRMFDARGWSPDSQWILVRTFPDGRYWVFSRDGTASREVATNAAFGWPTWWIAGLGSWPRFVQDSDLAERDPEASSSQGSPATAGLSVNAGAPN